MAVVKQSDVANAIDGANTGAILLYRMRWVTQFYGGDTFREYPVSMGAREIMRQIKCERADRRAVGRIADEMVQIAV